MKRLIIQTRNFAKKLDNLLDKKRLLHKDFESFKKKLVENPEAGDLIPGTGGVRKIRLKSSSQGKSGGFRICYFDDKKNSELFLVLIYQKNEQENLTAEEKKVLKELINAIKKK